jgi:prepilin-type N-terminal cleavage/methylation domain-containing protein
MQKPGFTILELVVVIIIVGIATTVAFPKMNEAIRHEAVRSARREVTTQLARAKGVAMQRSCRSTLQMRAATGRVWVESCKVTGTTRDTVGAISALASKYGVTVTTTADSVPFAPNSLGVAPAAVTMTFSKSGYTLNLVISSVGKATW